MRTLTLEIANSSRIIAPGLTHCVATTLLKVGLCQELSQRFVLEYCIKYKKKDISVVFISNPSEGHKKEDHAFVQIGPLKVPDSLLLGKNPQGTGTGCTINPDEVNQNIMEFFANNKESVCADPLLHCFGNLDSGLTPLLDYCSKYNLTHVIGVRSYHTTPSFVENASAIKSNAVTIAKKVESQIGVTHVKSLSEEKMGSNYQSTHPLFQNAEMRSLLKKYSLPDDTQASLEKGLRNAATNNNVADLELFIRVVKNINAQDTNPKMKRTALHWASVKGHKECYRLLQDAGAKANIPDADGKMPLNILQTPTVANVV